MNAESRTITSSMRRIALPLLVAAVLVIGTIIISGSSLIRIEDVTVNRILAGTYGTPDWRVQEVNPLLAQFLTLLYRIAASVNWYGLLLLALLLISAAAGISLTARKSGGLIPAVIVVSPILVLLTNSVMSTAVCALCATVGAFSLMEGLQRRKAGIARAILGGILFAIAAMLSLQWAIILGICAIVCWLPCMVRESRVRGLLLGVLILAVIASALFGYSALMYNSPELSAYRSNYSLYEKLQHSSLRVETDELLYSYGEVVLSEEHAEDDEHDHEAEVAPDTETIIPPNSFDAVGWTINDASLFFTRYGSDTKLVDPEVLQTLDAKASYWDFTPSRLFDGLFATLKKPQFLMLIALFIISALALLITSRRRGLVVLFAALVAFGGHILTIARFYDTFADIAPYYLLAIVVMLFYFDGEDAKAWFKRLFGSPWLRAALSVLVLVVFVAGLGGLLYYTRTHPVSVNRFTLEAVNFIKPYIAEHPDMLFIGDNPNDRPKPNTLTAPVRGEDENLLAGSYDLYSPRAATLMAKYDLTNPLPDSVGREDVAYIHMGFPNPINYRMVSAYNTYLDVPTELLSYPDYSEMIVLLHAMPQDEVDAIMKELELEKVAYEAFLDTVEILQDSGYFEQIENVPQDVIDTIVKQTGLEPEIVPTLLEAIEMMRQDGYFDENQEDESPSPDEDAADPEPQATPDAPAVSASPAATTKPTATATVKPSATATATAKPTAAATQAAVSPAGATTTAAPAAKPATTAATVKPSATAKPTAAPASSASATATAGG